MIKALRCLASQDSEGNCYEDIYNFMNPDKQRMRCGGDCDSFIPCPYHQNKYEVCFEDGECGEWLNIAADELEKLAKKSNGDRIREMTNSELAEIITCPYSIVTELCNEERNCEECWGEWLEKEWREIEEDE